MSGLGWHVPRQNPGPLTNDHWAWESIPTATTAAEFGHSIMSFQVILLLAAAFLTFVVGPIVLVWASVDHLRTKASDRPSGGGGVSNFVGAGLQEIDRLLTRPSIEHQIETEHAIPERESDDGE